MTGPSVRDAGRSVRFFGDWRDRTGAPGHYLHRSDGARGFSGLGPFAGLDRAYLEAARVPQEQGKGTTVHVAGHTIVTFWDFTGDPRGGSNSAFVVGGDVSTVIALMAALVRFPEVFKRIGGHLDIDGEVFKLGWASEDELEAEL